MPSFFESLKRMAQGKPVFDPSDQKQDGKQTPQTEPAPTADGAGQSAPQQHGPKVIPQAYITRWECRESGSQLDCSVSIENFSQVQLELDRFEMFGMSHDLGTFLRPGEEREFHVYSGSRPNTPNQTMCRVFYKDPTTDVFCSEHFIEFERLADGTYTIKRFRFVRVLDR